MPICAVTLPLGRLWRQLEARLNMYRMHARHLFEEVAVRAEQRILTFDPMDVDPVNAARLIRAQWRMPVGPVRHLAQWMEAAGCLLIEEDFGTPRVEGLSQWVDDYPVVLLNLRSPTDRKRLTLAHELGHLCLHAEYASEDMEHEATRFAGEFLMPADVIRPQLRNFTLGKLHDLKREWGTSMQALIERARELNLITPGQRLNLYKALSARGWRVREPLGDELVSEQAKLAGDIGDALATKGLSLDDIAELAGFSPHNSQHPFAPRRRALRAVR
jgi:Zn-dependent peptidase ImmA (M78 family)